MIAVDTSVVVAGFATWHDDHLAARSVLDAEPRLVAHCGFETYSVLTRLPPPHRAPPKTVHEFLRARFPSPWLTLGPDAGATLLAMLPEVGVMGGATYDALVGATAEAAGATLVTCDRCAIRVYDAVGASYRILGS